MYENGRGVDKNVSKAVEWYTKAAEQEDVYAEIMLADMYEDGWGVDKNVSKAK